MTTVEVTTNLNRATETIAQFRMGTGVKKVSLNDFCEVIEFNEAGYAPIVDFQSWRVAMLNYIDELEPNQINNFQCHLETDEVFVLLAGHCILFLAEVAENRQIITIHAVDMEPHRAYNIKQGIFHTHTLTQDAKVLIIENRDTSDLNSPKIMIDQTINEQLLALTAEQWGTQA